MWQIFCCENEPEQNKNWNFVTVIISVFEQSKQSIGYRMPFEILSEKSETSGKIMNISLCKPSWITHHLLTNATHLSKWMVG